VKELGSEDMWEALDIYALGSTVLFACTTMNTGTSSGGATAPRGHRPPERHEPLSRQRHAIGEGMIAIGGELYFCANDGVHGYELWKTMGRPRGPSSWRTSRRAFSARRPHTSLRPTGSSSPRLGRNLRRGALGAPPVSRCDLPASGHRAGVASSHAWDFTPSSRESSSPRCRNDGTGALASSPGRCPRNLGTRLPRSSGCRSRPTRSRWARRFPSPRHSGTATGTPMPAASPMPTARSSTGNGSGATVPATVEQTPGGGIVKGSHVYAEPGTYTVVVRVSDHLGEEAIASGSLVVTVERVPAAVRDLDCHAYPPG